MFSFIGDVLFDMRLQRFEQPTAAQRDSLEFAPHAGTRAALGMMLAATAASLHRRLLSVRVSSPRASLGFNVTNSFPPASGRGGASTHCGTQSRPSKKTTHSARRPPRKSAICLFLDVSSSRASLGFNVTNSLLPASGRVGASAHFGAPSMPSKKATRSDRRPPRHLPAPEDVAVARDGWVELAEADEAEGTGGGGGRAAATATKWSAEVASALVVSDNFPSLRLSLPSSPGELLAASADHSAQHQEQ